METTWVAIGAICSLLVAAATFIVALQTKSSLSQGREQMRAEQERHMDSRLPYIALHVSFDAQPGNDQEKRSFQTVIARNVGSGFAQHIEVSDPDIPNVGDFIVDPETARVMEISSLSRGKNVNRTAPTYTMSH